MTDAFTSLDTYRDAVLSQIEARRAYEIECDKLTDKKDKILGDFAHAANFDEYLKIMYDARVDYRFFNFSHKKTARCNVYAIEKLYNVVMYLVDAKDLNANTRAIILTLKNFTANQLAMSVDDARCALSRDSKAKTKERDTLIVKRSTINTTSTCDVQAATSLFALLHLKIVEQKRDIANQEMYILQDNETCNLLFSKMNAQQV